MISRLRSQFMQILNDCAMCKTFVAHEDTVYNFGLYTSFMEPLCTF
jgi:hypothetical protein